MCSIMFVSTWTMCHAAQAVGRRLDTQDVFSSSPDMGIVMPQAIIHLRRRWPTMSHGPGGPASAQFAITQANRHEKDCLGW